MGVGIEAESDTVVSVCCLNCLGDNPRLTKADARFIVQAVNAHEQLLAALKGLLPEEAGTKECDCGCEGDGEGMCDYTDALVAIAKATGGQP